MDGVLISQPIGTFDCIVHVPPPIVFMHAASPSARSRTALMSGASVLSQGGVDSSLRGDGMTSRGEEL